MNPYDFAVAKIKEAGDMIVALREEAFEISVKNNDPRDIVTSVDLQVNSFLSDAIQKTYPDHGIYSEEENNEVAQKEFTWVIDPIDGTSNFSRGIPHYASCLGLLKDGIPIIGAVYNPVTKELFSFEKGKGARLNGKPIRTSPTTDISKSHVFLHAGRKKELWEWGGTSYRTLLEHAHKTSNFASSGLDMCFVAAGRIEANIYGTLSTMDIAGAIGILQEAGGIVADKDGNAITFSAQPQKVVATNTKEILASLLKLI